MTSHLQDMLALNVTNYRFSDVDDFNEFYDSGQFEVNGLSMFQLNARSIDSVLKLNKFKRFLSSLKVSADVVVVGETCFNYGTAGLHELAGYDHYPACRESAGGGVSMYVRTSLEHRFVEKVDDLIYSVTVEVLGRGRNGPLTIVGYYRPPSYRNSSRFLAHLDGVLCAYSDRNCLILGDTNFNLLSDRLSGYCNVSNYSSLLQSYGFGLCNDRVTRPIKGTLLDHVLSNFVEELPHASVTIEVDFSDHAGVLTVIPLAGRSAVRRIAKESTDFDELRKKLYLSMDEISGCRYSDPNAYMADFVKALSADFAACTNVQHKLVKEAHLKVPWMNEHLLSMVKEDKKLFKRSKDPRFLNDVDMKSRLRLSNQNVEKWDMFYSRLYYERLFEDANDPKKTWRRINEVLGRKRKSSAVGEIVYDGKVAHDDESRASSLNSFFAEVGKSIAEKFGPDGNVNKYGTVSTNRHSIFLEPVCEREILVLINRLDNSKSPGADKITVKVLKECSFQIAPILVDVLNLVIFTGVYPDCLKLAQVVPLFKDGDRSDPSNYRPISMLPLLNKVFELSIYKRLVGFLNKGGFLYDRQYGFRAKSGTHTAVYEILDRVFLDIDDGLTVSALFLDLQKAFDCVDHGILAYKLERAGVRGVPLGLIRSYLSGRKQCVVIGEAMSQYEDVSMGVPQGSVLGPILFLIYINDIHKLPLSGTTALFADDTGVFFSGSSIAENAVRMNVDLALIRDFLDCNRLTLNVKKTKTIHFRKCDQSFADLVSLDGQVVEMVRVFKYLGLDVDFRLIWDVHVAKMCAKLASVCGILCKLKWLLPKSVLLKIYYALVHSRLSYLPSAWGTAHKKSIDQLQVLQKRCLKHVNRLPRRYPTNDLFRTHCPRILGVSGIIKYDVCSFIHKAINGVSHNVLRFNKRSHAYNTRFRDLLWQSAVKTNSGLKAISAHGCMLFNSLPARIRNLEPNRFQRELKRWLLAQQFPN